MKRKKLSADCDEESLELVKKASCLEKRTIANFIRVACLEKAKKILEVQNAR